MNRHWCEHFRVKVHRVKLPAVERELDVVERLIEECCGRIPSPAAAFERRMQAIARWLALRAHLLTNKQRLDRLLMLM